MVSRGLYLVLLFAASGAFAQTPGLSPEQSRVLTSCAHHRADQVVQRVFQAPGQPPLVWLTRGEAGWLAVPGDAHDPARCFEYRLQEGAHPGQFGVARALRLVAPVGCDEERCPLVGALEGPNAQVLGAAVLPFECTRSVRAAHTRLFPGRDGVILTCQSGAGAGYHERRALISEEGGRPRVLVSVETGSVAELSPAEAAEPDACVPWAAGDLTVVRPGPRPIVETREPKRVQDRQGVALVVRWTVGEGGAFVPTGSPTEKTFPACLNDKPKPGGRR